MQFVRVCGLIELVTTIAQLAVIECPPQLIQSERVLPLSLPTAVVRLCAS